MNFKTIKKILPGSIIIIIFILTVLSFFNFPSPKVVNLDTSWQQVLAHAFKHQWQAGIDYIFTYGPLGYLSLKNPSYEAELFYPAAVWWIVTSALLAMIFLAFWSQFQHWGERTLYFFILLVVISEVSRFSDTFYFLAMVGMTLLLLQPPPWLESVPRYWTAVNLALITFAVLALTKFIFFMFAGIVVFLLMVMIWQRYSLLLATFTALAFAGIIMGLWLLCQPSLANLPSFVIHSWQLARGYSEAMSHTVDFNAVWLALSAFGVITILVLLNYWQPPRTLAKFLSSGLVIISLFLNWKASFVRYETLIHGIMFFSFAIIIPWWLAGLRDFKLARPTWYHSLIWTNLLINGIGIFYVAGPHGYQPTQILNIWFNKLGDNVALLWDLPKYKLDYDTLTDQLKKQYDLPKIREEVMQAPMDMFSPQQGIVFLNGLNYQPRPLFQGYSAYTQLLLDKNADFYNNPRQAPEFVLFDIDSLDRRFPTSEDSQTLKVILRDYQPLFMEKGWLLLKRHPRETEREQFSAVSLTKTVKLGERMDLTDLSSKSLLLSLEIQPSWLGRLSKWLFQLPPLFLEVETTSGRFITFRLLPSLASSEFWLNPLLMDQIDWLNWYLGKPLTQVAAIRVIAPPHWQRLWQSTVSLKITESLMTPYPMATTTQNLIRLAINSIPTTVSTPNRLVLVSSEPEAGTKKIVAKEAEKPAVWIVECPGEMSFPVLAGNYQLAGQFGILPEGYEQVEATVATTTGEVQFSAYFIDATGQELPIFDKVLRPWQTIEDRQKINFDFSFQLTGAGTIVLRTRAIPVNTTLGQWAFWSGVQLRINTP